MEVRTEKSRFMVKSMTNTSAGITMNGEKLEDVTSFKYLNAILAKDGNRTTEVRIIIASVNAAMTRLHQLPHQVKALQVPRNPHPTVRLTELDSSRGQRKHDTGL